MNDKPNWRLIAECDLKPGEAFWWVDDNGLVGIKRSGEEYPKVWLEHAPCKGWMRCEGVYQIPPPPEPEKVEPITVEEWLKNYNVTHKAEQLLIKDFVEAIKQGKVKAV